MMGTIQYTALNPLSPEYPSPILIDGTLYSSAANAIESGKDPLAAVAILVSMNRNLYMPYRNYRFQGSYSEPLERMVHEILEPRMIHEAMIGWIMPLDITRYKAPPINMPFITVSRPIMLYEPSGSLWKQVSMLEPMVTEEYRVYGLEDGILLYVGSQGMFLHLDRPDRNLEAVLNSLGNSA